MWPLIFFWLVALHEGLRDWINGPGPIGERVLWMALIMFIFPVGIARGAYLSAEFVILKIKRGE